MVTSTVAFFLFIHIFGKSKSNSKIILYFLIVGLLNFNSQGGSYFIECNENCIIWSEQVKEVNEGSRELYVHWPMGEEILTGLQMQKTRDQILRHFRKK